MEFQENSLHEQIELKNKVKEYVLNILGKPLFSDDVVGFHGTSIEAVEFLLENGHLPGSPTHDKAKNKGDFFFEPRKNFFDKTKDDLEAKEVAAEYAADIAESHRFIKLLGLDISDTEIYDSYPLLDLLGPKESDMESVLQRFERRGLNKAAVIKIYRDVKKMRPKGVILGLSKEILTLNPIKGDDEHDLKVNAPQIGYKLFTALEPLGEEEKQFFSDMKKGV